MRCIAEDCSLKTPALENDLVGKCVRTFCVRWFIGRDCHITLYCIAIFFFLFVFFLTRTCIIFLCLYPSPITNSSFFRPPLPLSPLFFSYFRSKFFLLHSTHSSPYSSSFSPLSLLLSPLPLLHTNTHTLPPPLHTHTHQVVIT